MPLTASLDKLTNDTHDTVRIKDAIAIQNYLSLLVNDFTLTSIGPHVGGHEASQATPTRFATALVVTIPTTYLKKIK